MLSSSTLAVCLPPLFSEKRIDTPTVCYPIHHQRRRGATGPGQSAFVHHIIFSDCITMRSCNIFHAVLGHEWQTRPRRSQACKVRDCNARGPLTFLPDFSPATAFEVHGFAIRVKIFLQSFPHSRHFHVSSRRISRAAVCSPEFLFIRLVFRFVIHRCSKRRVPSSIHVAIVLESLRR